MIIKLYELLRNCDNKSKIVGVKPFSCHKCDRTFNSKYNVVRHLKQYHADRRMFKCSVCAREYKWVDSLHKHMKIHKLEVAVDVSVTTTETNMSDVATRELEEDSLDEIEPSSLRIPESLSLGQGLFDDDEDDYDEIACRTNEEECEDNDSLICL